MKNSDWLNVVETLSVIGSIGGAIASVVSQQGAVKDLREAAKLFFEKGDMANYQTARDLSKNFHNLDSQPRSDAPEKVALESLFA